MQLQSDPFLGWTTIEGRDYLVRQLNDHKAAVDFTELKTESLLEYAGVCGEMLARGHARAGDPAMLAGYMGTSERFDDAIGRFALQYADQTERDWQQLVHSRKSSGKTVSPQAAKSTGTKDAAKKAAAKRKEAKQHGAKHAAKKELKRSR
jgi:hypothetical protein